MKSTPGPWRLAGARVCVAAWHLAVLAAALALFSSGFFLTRVELPTASDCDIVPTSSDETRDARSMDDESPNWIRRGDDGSCWMPRRYRKAVVLVIDALRLDFVASTTSAEDGARAGDGQAAAHVTESGGCSGAPAGSSACDSRFYHGHMPVVRRLLTQQPRQSALYRFVADPPTVTMQRLKGLTSGSLPTFVDVKDNFASAEITEDNIVAQLKAQRRSAVFMGDDTWTSLFPRSFNASFPFPSFNVKDLHTVDDGVTAHLVPEIVNATADWDIVVAHCLGVDHVGHRHGPSHPAMRDKLRQMNELVDDVTARLSEDTLFVLMGDHGMTFDGNHGGATPDEVSAALFLYTPNRDGLLRPGVDDALSACREEADSHHDDSAVRSHLCNDEAARGIGIDSRSGDSLSGTNVGHVSQVDLVPTLSLLLGVPVPFASLGVAIPNIAYGPATFSRDGSQESRAEADSTAVLRALELNSAQIRRYLTAYSEAASGTFPEDALERLEAQFAAASTATHKHWAALSASTKPAADGDAVCRMWLQYARDSAAMCRAMWTQFDVGAMGWGLLCFLTAVLCLMASVTAADGVSVSLLSPPQVSATATTQPLRAGEVEWTRTAVRVLPIRFAPVRSVALAALAAVCTGALLNAPGAMTVTAGISHALGLPSPPLPPLTPNGGREGAGPWSWLIDLEASTRKWRPPFLAMFALTTELAYLAEFARHRAQCGRAIEWVMQGTRHRAAAGSGADGTSFPRASGAALVVLVLRCAALFSNSYIVAEKDVTGFLAASLVSALGASAWCINAPRTTVAAAAAFLVSGRAATLLFDVPAGVADAKQGDRGATAAVLARQHITLVGSLLPLAAMTLVAPLLLRALRRLGPVARAVAAACGVSHTLILAHWALVARGVDRVALPRAAFTISGLSLLFLCASVAIKGMVWVASRDDDDGADGGAPPADAESGAPSRGRTPPTRGGFRRWFGYCGDSRVLTDESGRFVRAGTQVVTGSGQRMVVADAHARRDRADGSSSTSAAGGSSATSIATANLGTAGGMHDPPGQSALEDLSDVQRNVVGGVTLWAMCMLGPLVLLLGPSSPWILACCGCQVAAAAVLLRQFTQAADSASAGASIAAARDIDRVPAADVGAAAHGGDSSSKYRKGAKNAVSDVVAHGTMREASAVSLDAVLVFALLGSFYFYATGHDSDFNTIAWMAPFVVVEEYDFVLCGMLVAVHTFAAHLLAVAAVQVAGASAMHPAPSSSGVSSTGAGLLLHEPANRGARNAKAKAASRELSPSQWHCVLAQVHSLAPAEVDDDGETDAGVRSSARFAADVCRSVEARGSSREHTSWRVLMTYLLCFAVPMACTMVFVTMERRHLMVWAIFAPKYVFDAATLLAVAGLTALSTAAAQHWHA